MEKKRPIPTIVGVFFAVITILQICMFLTILQDITETNLIIVNVLGCLASLSAFVYFLTGFKKSSAVFYKIFCGLYALVFCMNIFYYITLYSAAHAIVETSDIIILILSIASFIIMSVFFAGRDLGRAVSSLLAVMLFVCSVVKILMTLSSPTATHITYAVEPIIPIILYHIVVFKYKDKETRGAKNLDPSAEDKRPLPVSVSIVIACLGFAFIAYNLYAIISSVQASAFDITQSILFCLASVAALIYCEMGFKKSAAKFHKLFCVMYAVTFAFSIVAVIYYLFVTGDTRLYIARLGICLFIIIVALVLAFAKNLGKKTSYIFAALAIMCTVADAIMLLDKSSVFSHFFLLELVLPIVLTLSVIGKYRDKDARGTV